MDRGSYREAIEETESFSMDQTSYRKLSRSYQDCLKIVFQRREKHRYECNQACYSTKDPNNILGFQKHLLTRKMLST